MGDKKKDIIYMNEDLFIRMGGWGERDMRRKKEEKK